MVCNASEEKVDPSTYSYRNLFHSPALLSSVRSVRVRSCPLELIPACETSKATLFRAKVAQQTFHNNIEHNAISASCRRVAIKVSDQIVKTMASTSASSSSSRRRKYSSSSASSDDSAEIERKKDLQERDEFANRLRKKDEGNTRKLAQVFRFCYHRLDPYGLAVFTAK